MKLKKILLAFGFSLVLSSSSFASPSINDMQSCQALLDFVDEKLSTNSKYSVNDVKTVKNGLNQYNEYIQKEIVTPGLIKFNAGDITKAKAMQKQVDDYKLSLVNAYKKRYVENRMYTDYAIAINNCAKKAVPSGEALENLKASLNTIIKLAKMN